VLLLWPATSQHIGYNATVASLVVLRFHLPAAYTPVSLTPVAITIRYGATLPSRSTRVAITTLQRRLDRDPAFPAFRIRSAGGASCGFPLIRRRFIYIVTVITVLLVITAVCTGMYNAKRVVVLGMRRGRWLICNLHRSTRTLIND